MNTAGGNKDSSRWLAWLSLWQVGQHHLHEHISKGLPSGWRIYWHPAGWALHIQAAESEKPLWKEDLGLRLVSPWARMAPHQKEEKERGNQTDLIKSIKTQWKVGPKYLKLALGVTKSHPFPPCCLPDPVPFLQLLPHSCSLVGNQ